MSAVMYVYEQHYTESSHCPPATFGLLWHKVKMTAIFQRQQPSLTTARRCPQNVDTS